MYAPNGARCLQGGLNYDQISKSSGLPDYRLYVHYGAFTFVLAF